MNFVRFQDVADLGSNNIPDSVESCFKDSMNSLDREIRESALGNGEGIGLQIWAIQELGRIGRDQSVIWYEESTVAVKSMDGAGKAVEVSPRVGSVGEGREEFQ